MELVNSNQANFFNLSFVPLGFWHLLLIFVSYISMLGFFFYFNKFKQIKNLEHIIIFAMLALFIVERVYSIHSYISNNVDAISYLRTFLPLYPCDSLTIFAVIYVIVRKMDGFYYIKQYFPNIFVCWGMTVIFFSIMFPSNVKIGTSLIMLLISLLYYTLVGYFTLWLILNKEVNINFKTFIHSVVYFSIIELFAYPANVLFDANYMWLSHNETIFSFLSYLPGGSLCVAIITALLFDGLLALFTFASKKIQDTHQKLPEVN